MILRQIILRQLLPYNRFWVIHTFVLKNEHYAMLLIVSADSETGSLTSFTGMVKYSITDKLIDEKLNSHLHVSNAYFQPKTPVGKQAKHDTDFILYF